jgi:hypothetical protein
MVVLRICFLSFFFILAHLTSDENDGLLVLTL